MLLKLIAITSTLQFVLQVRQYLSVTESYGCHYSNTLQGQIRWLLCPKLQTREQSRVRGSSPSPSLQGLNPSPILQGTTSPSPSPSPQNKDSSPTRVHCRTRVLHHCNYVGDSHRVTTLQTLWNSLTFPWQFATFPTILTGTHTMPLLLVLKSMIKLSSSYSMTMTS